MAGVVLPTRIFTTGEIHTAGHHNANINAALQVLADLLTGDDSTTDITIAAPITFTGALVTMSGNLTVNGTLVAKSAKIVPFAAVSMYFTASNGATPVQDSGTNRFEMECANNVENGVVLDGIVMTDNYNGGSIAIKVLWYAPVEVIGDVHWELKGRGYRDGLAHDLALSSIDTATTTVPGTAGEIQESSFTWSSSLPQAGDKVYMELRRLGGNAADTLDDDVRVRDADVAYVG